MQTGNRIVNWTLYSETASKYYGFSHNALYRKSGGGIFILCQCPALAGHRMKIFSSAVVEPTDSRASIKQVLAFHLEQGSFEEL
jgi:hypothetical protein